ncbi:MAG: phosphate acyltransferase PlsX [Bacteroidota bacterium]|nr:phosphate acyltransferase PlsX [Bacteroidota bacterium]
MNIGLDIMGGDFAPEAIVLGAIEARKEIPSEHSITLVGDTEIAKNILLKEQVDPSLFTLVHASEVIEMGDHATKAMRSKLDSSINVGFKLLSQGKLDSFSSAGNSGAMLIGSMFAVRPISGVIRPCITSVLPKESGGVGVILDVGINADCKPDVLYQFAVLGSLYAEFVYNIKSPKVGLLNIGEEKEKGNLLAQATFELMEDSNDFNFIGNVEGRDLFSDLADVIVCDGFTGNVILKEAEAFYSLIAKRGLLDEYFNRFNYENYGGTPVLGVNGNVLIGHGISNPKAIKNMLNLSLSIAQADLPNKIKKAFK